MLDEVLHPARPAGHASASVEERLLQGKPQPFHDRGHGKDGRSAQKVFCFGVTHVRTNLNPALEARGDAKSVDTLRQIAVAWTACDDQVPVRMRGGNPTKGLYQVHLPLAFADRTKAYDLFFPVWKGDRRRRVKARMVNLAEFVPHGWIPLPHVMQIVLRYG